MDTFIIECTPRDDAVAEMIAVGAAGFTKHADKLVKRHPEAKLKQLWLTTDGVVWAILDAPDEVDARSFVEDLVAVKSELRTQIAASDLQQTAQALSDAHTKMFGV